MKHTHKYCDQSTAANTKGSNNQLTNNGIVDSSAVSTTKKNYFKNFVIKTV